MRSNLAVVFAVLFALAGAGSDLFVSPYSLAYTHFEIGGHRVVGMIDTGSQLPLMISSRLAKAVAFKGHDTGSRVQGYDHQPLPVIAGKVHDIRLGQILVGTASAAVVGDQVESVSKQVGTPYDSVIGWPLLRRYYMLLDYANRRFALSMSPLKAGAVVFEFPYEEVRGTLEVSGSVDGRATRFMFDTGAPQCNLDSTIFKLAAGQTRPAEITLGGHTVELTCRGRDLSINKSDGVEAVLGEDLMSKHRVLFDPVRKYISLTR